jgi:hypothetical protein
MMKNIQILLFLLLVTILAGPAQAKESREQKQARLDAVCEVERQKKIAPMRSKVTADCVSNKELPSQQECETFYADYGERMGRRAPLFYDLPECVTAFDYLENAQASD